ncbi:MAG: hypothetical protein EHM24_06610 [Acidobacteria bacterium]|nr:MAG: hypothetical protein EHM24_20580 [Acidobacteriota bacterium]RPJ74164.1 MAG: hypothetical protein EHM24_06610 [Acidobacteriota bacterium]
MNPVFSDTARRRATREQRESERQALAVAGRLVWKDSRGTTRFNSVVIRDVSETGAYVESISGAPIPLYRLVSLQAELGADAELLPNCLRRGKVLSAVYRVGPSRPATGTPAGYALRLLVEPSRRTAPMARPDMPVFVMAAAMA